MIRFVHTADVHYGVENYGKIDPETGIHSRLIDFHQAFNRVIDYAIAEKVDFFLFAGDAYKTAHPTPTQQRLLMQSFLRLYEANIPVVIIVGNHDNATSFGKAHALDIFKQLPLEGFHVLARPGHFVLETRNGPCTIIGIPWPSRAHITLQRVTNHERDLDITEHLSSLIADLINEYAQEIDPTIPAVLGAHLTVESGIFSGSEKKAIYGKDPVFLISQLAQPCFDYVALGHLHRYQNLNPDGYPAVVYSGSTERIDFGERKEEKGFCLVEIPEKGKARHTFIRIATRPFIQISVNLDGTKDLTEQIIATVAGHKLKHAVVKIVYHLPAGTRDTVNLTAVQQACAEAHYLAGIFPVKTHTSQQKRNITSAGARPLTELIDYYLAAHPELDEHKESIKTKALALYAEIEKGPEEAS